MANIINVNFFFFFSFYKSHQNKATYYLTRKSTWLLRSTVFKKHEYQRELFVTSWEDKQKFLMYKQSLMMSSVKYKVNYWILDLE